MLPQSLVEWRRRHASMRVQSRYAALPLRETFERVYADAAWTGTDSFKSGAGSVEGFAAPYSSRVLAFIRSFRIRGVVDLGCGNYRVGSLLSPHVQSYTGVDIVRSLIEHNRKRHGSANVRFECLDVTSTELPSGDLCLVRQVLQHLTNEEIAKALTKCARYPHTLVTEHVYIGPSRRANVDIPHGPGTRVSRRSGVFIDEPPFSVRADVLFDLPYAANEILRTWHIVHNDW
jgi:SAM-dependent methyltransferase